MYPNDEDDDLEQENNLESEEYPVPLIDVYLENSRVCIDLELPDLILDSVDLLTKDGKYLFVTGIIAESNKKRCYIYNEITRGRFNKLIELPFAIDTEKADLDYEGGILHILVDKQLKKTKDGKIVVSKGKK